jgi:hypothetical protein
MSANIYGTINITIFIGLMPAELVTSELLAAVKCYIINSALFI